MLLALVRIFLSGWTFGHFGESVRDTDWLHLCRIVGSECLQSARVLAHIFGQLVLIQMDPNALKVSGASLYWVLLVRHIVKIDIYGSLLSVFRGGSL